MPQNTSPLTFAPPMTNLAQPDWPPGLTWPAGAAPVACVDVGGTKVAVSVADQHGLRGRLSEPTVKQGAPDALGQQVLRLIGQSCLAAGVPMGQIGAVGVSSCGPFVRQGGWVELAAPNICGGLAGASRGLPNDWTRARLEAPLRTAFADVRICNDGVAALQAERRWGALQGWSHCAYVTWSTGVGLGLCVDGRPLLGKNGNAGHAGHMFVSDNDNDNDNDKDKDKDNDNDSDSALCGCGNVGDVEGLIGGHAIGRRFAAQGYADAAALLAAAEAGQPAALALADELCRVMGRMLYNLTITLDLEAISLGGSVFWHHRALLLPRLQAQLQGRLPALTDGVQLLPAGLQDRVGDYAALALVI